MDAKAAPEAQKRSEISSIVIRARRPHDAGALCDLLNLPGVRFGTLRVPFHSPEEIGGWIEKAQPGNRALVALDDERIVGSCDLYRHAGRRMHVGGIGLVVHDDCLRRGIGATLMGHLLEIADQWLGLLRLELDVYVDNVPAIRLFEKFDFKVEGVKRADTFRDGRYVDSYFMARLNPAAFRPAFPGADPSEKA